MSYLAEQNVIGSLLIDSNAINKVYAKLNAEMFRSELLGLIFKEFQRGFDNGYDVNLVVLLQKIGGDAFPESIVAEEIKSCIAATDTSASIESYANVIVNDYKAHRLNKIVSSIKISPSNINSQIGAILQEIEALQDGRQSSSKELSAIVTENRDKYFCEHPPGLKVGFDKLDELLGGLEGGDMIVIGARPAVGKSALVTQIANYFSDQHKRVSFYNLEMSDKQMYERFVVNESGIGLTRLKRAKKFLGDEKEKFDMANEKLSKKSNLIISTGSKTLSEIRAECRHMDYDVIIIDYLQLIKPDKGYRGSRREEIGEISRAIKGLAMELKIPIIALSQLNRASELKETKEPTMAELKEAGDIEQDASVIILLWNIDDEKVIKGCKIDKNRQGLTGTVYLKFNGDLMRFEETEVKFTPDGFRKMPPKDSTPFD